MGGVGMTPAAQGKRHARLADVIHQLLDLGRWPGGARETPSATTKLSSMPSSARISASFSPVVPQEARPYHDADRPELSSGSAE